MEMFSSGCFAFASVGKPHWAQLEWHWRAGGNSKEISHLESGLMGSSVTLK